MNFNIKELSTAFVLSDVYEKNTKVQLTKLNQFVNLAQLSEMSVTVKDCLPSHGAINGYDLYFVDCFNLESDDALSDDVMQLALNTKVVLFNCCHNAFCEKLAILAGIQGIFYLDDKADIVIKGIETIKKAQRWFKRSVMNSALSDLLKNQSDKRPTIKDKSDEIKTNLTKREKMIANMISSGAQNKEIAEQLHISPNTVKTHLYSIFRKTQSRNRVELLTWSQQFSAS